MLLIYRPVTSAQIVHLENYKLYRKDRESGIMVVVCCLTFTFIIAYPLLIVNLYLTWESKSLCDVWLLLTELIHFWLVSYTDLQILL